MTLQLETRAALIHSAILEDRTEIRILKDRVSQTVTMLATASFAVAAYAINKVPMRFVILTDVGFLILLWVAVWPLRRDLLGARRCLEFREDMLRKLGTPEEAPFNLYPVVPEAEKVRVTDDTIDRLIRLATLTLVVKMAFESSGLLGNL